MTRIQRCCILGLALLLTGGNPPPAAAAQAATGTVGILGAREAFECQGNRAFSREQILDGLSYQIDYHLAAHPVAPLSGYLARLERQIALGYQHAGFPDVAVTVTSDTARRKVVARITEGPRYRCGDLVLAGHPAMTNASVRRRITDTLAGLDPSAPTGTNEAQSVWVPGAPVQFDDHSREKLEELVGMALGDLGYFEPKVMIGIDPEPGRPQADLHIDIANDGIHGRIQEIEVNGLRINTRAQLLRFLDLKPGMDLAVGLLTTVSNRLRASARFYHQDVRHEPLPELGQFKLVFDLEELRDAPSLDQPLPPAAAAMLKFGEWLSHWPESGDDLVCTIRLATQHAQAQIEFILSSAGVAIAARTPSTNGPSPVQYAIVAAPHQLGFHSPWRGRRFVVDHSGDQSGIKAFITFRPDTEEKADQKVNLQVGAGMVAKAARRPFDVLIDVAPVALLRESLGSNLSLEGGIVRLEETQGPGIGHTGISIEAATGRLIEADVTTKAFDVRVRVERESFQKLAREITSASAAFPNDYVTNHGFASWVTYAATDAIESPGLEGLLTELLLSDATETERKNALADLHHARNIMAQIRLFAGQPQLMQVLEPLGVFSREAEAPEEFQVPPDGAVPIDRTGMAGVSGYMLAHADQFVPPRSWPWVLLRETAFNLAGQGRHTEAELGQLIQADDIGPVGCLATAHLVGRVSPPAARAFAERGLTLLRATDFQKDYRVLLHTNAILGNMANNLVGLLRTLTEAQVTVLTSNLPPTGARLLRDLSRHLRANPSPPPGVAAWPAFEQHWTDTLRSPLEQALNRFLPQAQFLTDPKALFERGRAIISRQVPGGDVAEAAQCFRKAAEAGHGGAQLELGNLHLNGLGVDRRPSEALRWYRLAAAQHEPHAACRIGDLYREGEGVTKDPKEAARWYLTDATNGCGAAQFHLGQFHEAQLQMPEALTWYRRSAEGGLTQAQARLGDILSDGFSTTPNYEEACQWLLLAVEGEANRLNEFRLRRAKAKLTAEQIQRARDRADEIRKRHEEKAKGPAQAPAGTRSPSVDP